jgi:lipid-A-disaccharide synthase
MLIAGEASGDLLAAELVTALREKVLVAESRHSNDLQPLRTELAPRFFGAGGPKMAAAGVDLAFDLTQHSLIGIPTLKNLLPLRERFQQLLKLAIEQQPDAIIGVDYGGFNQRFGHAVKQYVRKHRSEFVPWNPKIVQFVSPQVWASRAGRAYQLARDYDLLLSIFPFEKDWYNRRVPKLHVEYVGHPMIERFIRAEGANRKAEGTAVGPTVLLLPGSRKGELKRHLPVMAGALKLIREKLPGSRARMVLPDPELKQLADDSPIAGAGVEIQVGDLPQALAGSDIAISKTGTITMECAFFGVPTVAFYKASWFTYQIGKRIVTVKSITMPNLLANQEVFPEFIQDMATPENIARAALELLQNESQRTQIKKRLAEVIASLGGPGATRRAAEAIVQLIERH